MLHLKANVEAKTGHVYNYALIEYFEDGSARMSPHLDSANLPTPTFNFGDTRVIRCTTPAEPPVDIELKHALLLILDSSTNRERRYEILPNNQVKQGSISVTFRDIKVERKRKLAAELIEETTTDSLFGNIKSSTSDAIPASTPDCEKRTIFRCDLNDDFYLSLEYFKKHLKIHIRKYSEKDGVLHPTRTGVTMSEETWYAFFKKFFSFTLKYKSNSFIANNDILVFNLKDRALIQSYHNANFIHLNELQIINLIDNIHTLNDYLLNFKFNERLPQILRECTVILPSLTSEEEMNLTSKLVKCIEQELVTCFQEIFICNACQFFTTQSQEKHNCVTQSSLEKYRYLGERVLMLLKFDHTILEFANVHVSERFLGNICFDFLKELIFQ